MTDALNTLFRSLPVWMVYLIGSLPAPILLYMAATGGLGIEPIEALEHELGQTALKLLVLGLAITPARRFLGLNLLKFRRAIGLLTFFYVLLHLLVWLLLDVQVLSEIWKDIVKRPYITIGMLGFALLLPLALTSNNWSVRRLGARWRKLHWLVYPAALLGAMHYVMLARGFQLEPLIYLALISGLLLLRLPAMSRRAPA